jgi:predicted RNA-binding Zn ribbon-like protein
VAITGQVHLDSYGDAGVVAAVELVNELASSGSAEATGQQLRAAVERILSVDPPSLEMLREADAPRFQKLALSLRDVFEALEGRDVDAAAGQLNDLLSKHPAHPHLAKEQGRWRLHHHPAGLPLVPMWTAICAEAMARMIGAGHERRFGICEASDCDRAYFDVTKNASRRFCSTTCQNRIKAAAFRRRHRRNTTTPSRRKPARHRKD